MWKHVMTFVFNIYPYRNYIQNDSGLYHATLTITCYWISQNLRKLEKQLGFSRPTEKIFIYFCSWNRKSNTIRVVSLLKLILPLTLAAFLLYLFAYSEKSITNDKRIQTGKTYSSKWTVDQFYTVVPLWLIV